MSWSGWLEALDLRLMERAGCLRSGDSGTADLACHPDRAGYVPAAELAKGLFHPGE